MTASTSLEVTVWYSTHEFAEYIVANTKLASLNPVFSQLHESDAAKPRDFHALPDHIKKILYLDAPDLIVEIDGEPMFSVELSTEAGTGHNAFQRFARLAASIENGVPAFYIYPEAAIVTRDGGASTRWDCLNPAVLHALDQAMAIHGIPALLYYFPSDYRTHGSSPLISPNRARKGLIFDKRFKACPCASSKDMKQLFDGIDAVIDATLTHGTTKARNKMLSLVPLRQRRSEMQTDFALSSGGRNVHDLSPLTSTHNVPTAYLLRHLEQYVSGGYTIGKLLRSRQYTTIYAVDAKFRGDPYPGALAAIDYMACREGTTFEDRRNNLVLAWGKLSINHRSGDIGVVGPKSTIKDFVKEVRQSESKNLLTKDYSKLSAWDIPRYYMQVRYGSTYSKNKTVRVFAYFADAILFPDGALWRDG